MEEARQRACQEKAEAERRAREEEQRRKEDAIRAQVEAREREEAAKRKALTDAQAKLAAAEKEVQAMNDNVSRLSTTCQSTPLSSGQSCALAGD